MTQVVAPFESPMLRAARVLDDPKRRGRNPLDLTSEQKRVARHMSWNDSVTVADFLQALGLNCSVNTLRRHLRACNIRTRGERRRDHPECGR